MRDIESLHKELDTVKDYNTSREPLQMSEYGRSIQEMVNHCKTIKDRDERTNCAYTIVGIMSTMTEQSGNAEDFQQKLWNHLARISKYELDIDYPVEIERYDEEQKMMKVNYPQKPIRRRHYGRILEDLTKKITEVEDPEEREELAHQVANQMKRSLAYWDIDVMSDRKVVDDLADYTNGKVTIDPINNPLVTDGELLSNLISTSITKKKKKK
ncbi:MAG: DUF4290 domain-containing protein [Bacteroidaceae bacterium]|nr:DUF4290 domain-containing protein [Bacteroidaceae bacterium]